MLKVYTWIGTGGEWLNGWDESLLPGNRDPQVRYVVAAPSWVKAVDAVRHATTRDSKAYGSIIGTEHDQGRYPSQPPTINGFTEAMGTPGHAFWRPVDNQRRWMPV